MIVTDVKKVARQSKYDIFVDGEFFVRLTDVSVINCGIKTGLEITALVQEKIYNALNSDAFETLLNILSQTAITEMNARLKLKAKGLGEEHIDYAIQKAIDYGYINDEAFAKSYIKYTTRKSKLRISAELQSKGIDKKIFSEFLDEYDEYQACYNAMKSAIKVALDDDKKKKVFARFYAQGFAYQTIKDCYEDILSEIE